MTDSEPIKFTIDTDTPPASAKPRRGRPPGSKNRTTASGTTDAATLKQALATLDSLYSFTASGLLMLGLPQTAMDWAESAEKLSKTNGEALKASPRLAKAIANAGNVGGATTFVVAHAMAISSLVQGVNRELAARRIDQQTEVEKSTE